MARPFESFAADPGTARARKRQKTVVPSAGTEAKAFCGTALIAATDRDLIRAARHTAAAS
jgi:hypothetical protein